jgi:Transposase DDE domain group 1
LHPLLATISTPIAAAVIAGARLRRGSAASAKCAASFVAEAITTARQAGATGVLLARMDSAFDSHAVVATCIRAGVYFSITTNKPARAGPRSRPFPSTPGFRSPTRTRSTTRIAGGGSPTPRLPRPPTPHTADDDNPSRSRSELIVRWVKDKNVAPHQGELFTAWRYHAFITDSTLHLVTAEKQHREHAIIEQVNADLKDSALAHLPSGSFSANAAWLTLAAIAHNLTRAAGCLASTNTDPPGPTGDTIVEKLDRPAVSTCPKQTP